jgi:methyltransferase
MTDNSFPWYLTLLAGVVVIRVIELRFSARHQIRLVAEGAAKVREPLYPLMVGVHVSLLVASPLEVWLGQRPFLPWLGWPMLVVLGGCLAGRVWVWQSLGEQWNTQIVNSRRPIVDSGPYRYVRHPNYTIVITEMFALPLVHTAYLTALTCSIVNALILRRRIRYEEAALFTRPDYVTKMGTKPRFLPARGSRNP